MKNNKVLITGITGMVGSHLLDLLVNTNSKIYGLYRSSSKLDNIAHHSKKINEGKLNLIFGDLRDPISIENALKKIKPDQVYHLAAQSYPATSFTNPLETYDTNINGTVTLLEALKRHSINSKIHICSSSEVYGRVSKKFIPIKESTPFHPASPYAISKVGTDLNAKFYAEAYNMNIFITRMFTHTGPRRTDFFHESSFAKQIALIENKIINPSLKCGNLNSMRTYADVRDAVNAYYLLMNSKKTKKGDIFNIGGDYSCTVGDTLKFLITNSTVKKIKIITDKERLRPIDADLQIPNIEKFKSIVRWKKKYSYRDTMLDLLEFWRNKIRTTNEHLVR